MIFKLLFLGCNFSALEKYAGTVDPSSFYAWWNKWGRKYDLFTQTYAHFWNLRNNMSCDIMTFKYWFHLTNYVVNVSVIPVSVLNGVLVM